MTVDLLPEGVPPFASRWAKHYTPFSRIAMRSAMHFLYSAGALGGNSRPPAFFFGGPASFVGRRDSGMVPAAFLGLRRLGRYDPALRGCQNPAGLCGSGARTHLRLCVLCL